MLKLKKEELLNEKTVNKIQFEEEWYFDVDSVAAFLKEDLSAVETLTLPFPSGDKKSATIDNIEKGRNLSEFNKALLKIKNFKDK